MSIEIDIRKTWDGHSGFDESTEDASHQQNV